MTLVPVPSRPSYHAIEWYDEVPRSVRGITIVGLLLFVFAICGFGYWAFNAPLAAAVISQGSFVATGKNTIVQHLEGGIINEITVEEGDLVQKGQPLIYLDETAARANERELFLRLARLEAINARLQAEFNEGLSITFPENMQGVMTDPDVAEIVASQNLNFAGSRAKYESDIAMLNANIDALDVRGIGLKVQFDAINEQLALLQEDFVAKNQLFEKGLIRMQEVNALRRAVMEATGQIGRLDAEIKETGLISEKYRQQIVQTRNAYRQGALDEMQAIEAELDSVREQHRNAQNVMRRTVINAPVTGVIVRMYYNSPGGVIEGGKPIAEILPQDVPLIIETQIPRTEIDNVRVGQLASVQLTALNRRTTPILEGHVFYISADSVPGDMRTQQQDVYLARISLDPSEMARVQGFSPTPGMPAQIMVETETRTFFDYLAKPIKDSMSRAFREN
ncbi:HlyD family type I secretion periplasmic adaptor subunit [Phaeovulum sp.]|uniref:HlyD family type I secretion periplasmic adaptor subunit n=1 Tax=Phaeovulum sp. TaxID=2934796 RepID=UPI00356B08CD